MAETNPAWVPTVADRIDRARARIQYQPAASDVSTTDDGGGEATWKDWTMWNEWNVYTGPPRRP